MNLELFGEVATSRSIAIPPCVLQLTREADLEEQANDAVIEHAPGPKHKPKPVKTGISVWNALMEDARRRARDKQAFADSEPTTVEEDSVGGNDVEPQMPVGSFENLLSCIEDSDGPEVVMCKLMGNLMWNDLRAIVKRRNALHQDTGPDLFGFEERDQDELRVYDAMQWIYGFQDPRPAETIDGVAVVDVMVSFDFVCERLGWDGEWIRRVATRCLREHFAGLLLTIEAFGDEGLLLKCVHKLEDYIDVTDWRN
ncbi:MULTISPECIES: hypothetical protein [unclassified Paraburkholderia]|uniref:hypothetical protein n=1 Tax=unclassified Paraburkholderia TaxID=2615204 RepID=UPI002AB15BBF|nr:MULTISPECIES: hypothetical protein [unclassified Paraburkholderia]